MEHHHRFTAGKTTWHITWGTYGSRLHGDNRPRSTATTIILAKPSSPRTPSGKPLNADA